MATKITKTFLQEHFCKHDSITLYKADGTPVTFAKHHNLVVNGGHHSFTFKTYDDLMAFYQKHHLCLKPVINIG